MKKLIVVTDLGRLASYRIEQEDGDPSPTFTDVREISFSKEHSHTAARVTDQAGRFPSGSDGMSYGERHGEEEEALHHQIQRVAAAVDEVANAEPEGSIYFAAPKPVHRQITDLLDAETRQRISRSLEQDLTKHAKLDLLQRFEQA